MPSTRDSPHRRHICKNYNVLRRVWDSILLYLGEARRINLGAISMQRSIVMYIRRQFSNAFVDLPALYTEERRRRERKIVIREINTGTFYTWLITERRGIPSEMNSRTAKTFQYQIGIVRKSNSSMKNILELSHRSVFRTDAIRSIARDFASRTTFVPRMEFPERNLHPVARGFR